ncbi:hypothetical protein [Kutzneria albida]|uniref:Transcriptional regulator n=1 Tax=Kutzneria albida DSM 43870 TaxID=1449976 RepID=W5WMT7_9PSEU|nr:hypothetical protein [Kutzneria albida]AHI01862.1 hypothetical protein KALB_8505 [Kutzneria albida DSM 43870]
MANDALLADAELSNVALARSVVAAGAREGIHLGTTATTVARMLTGAQPRWPVTRLVAAVLSKRLGYSIGVSDCGFTDRSEPDTTDYFECSRTVGGTIGLVAELSGKDMARRNFLMGSAFTAAAFAQPALMALTVPPVASAASTGGGRITASEVQVALETVRHYEGQHRRYGGAAVHQQLVQFLNAQAVRAQEASYTEAVGRQLLSALSQGTVLAALTAVECGRHALAQRYYTQALNLAMHAADRPFAANVLSEMSRVAIDIAHASGSEADTIHNGQHAAALARSALEVAGPTATPALISYLHAIEARGFAALGDARATSEAVANAQRAFDRVHGEEPEWFSFYGEADIRSDIGQCLRDTGRPNQGVALLERSLTALPAGRVTARAKTKVHIAAAYLELREFEQAAKVADEAVAEIGSLASQRSRDRVRALQHRVRRHGKENRLTELDRKLTEFLADKH